MKHKNMLIRFVLPIAIFLPMYWSSTFISAETERGIINLTGQIGDLRNLCLTKSELSNYIKQGKCFVDVRGRVWNTEKSLVNSQVLDCPKGFTVGDALHQLRVEIRSIGGIQLRVFKRDQILQTSRFVKNKPTNEVEQLHSLVLEPGDALLFTKQE